MWTKCIGFDDQLVLRKHQWLYLVGCQQVELQRLSRITGYICFLSLIYK